MSDKICPICGTGKCQFRNGIMCDAWICASGLMDGGNDMQGQKVFDEKNLQRNFDLMGLMKMFQMR